ncbi:MAG: adenylate kinase family protein [Candidatus Kapaibacterium sp.]
MKSTTKKLAAIFLGPPGSGKSSVAEQLEAEEHTATINTGRILRKEINKQSDLGEKIKDYIQQGKLAPTPLVKEAVSKILADTDEEYVVFDGFPRSRSQLKEFGEICRDNNCELTAVVIFETNREVARKRLTGRRICEYDGRIYNLYFNPPPGDSPCAKDKSLLTQRDDDKAETVENRFEEYDETTRPLVEFFLTENPGITHSINTEKEMEEMFVSVLSTLKQAGWNKLPV